MWIYYNCNPLGRETNDCAIRSISLAEGISWDRCYEKLSAIAQEQGILLDDVSFIEPYLNSKYPTICHKCDKKRMFLKDFLKKYPKGIYLCAMRGHITCVIDGIIYDTWDCSNNMLWHTWKVK